MALASAHPASWFCLYGKQDDGEYSHAKNDSRDPGKSHSWAGRTAFGPRLCENSDAELARRISISIW